MSLMSKVRTAGLLLVGIVALGAAASAPAAARSHTHVSVGIGIGGYYPAYRPYYGYPVYGGYYGPYYGDPFYRPFYYAPRPVVVTPYPTYYGTWDLYDRPYYDRPAVVTRPVERRMVNSAPSDGIDRSYCREYQSTITVDGKEQPNFGTACKQPDGSWRMIN